MSLTAAALAERAAIQPQRHQTRDKDMRATLRGAPGRLVPTMLLLLCACALLPEPATSQRLVQANDSLRVNTTAGTFAGTAVAADSRHLLLSTHRNWNPIELELRPGDLKSVEVYAGTSSRLRGTMIGAVAGALWVASFEAALRAEGTNLKYMGLTRFAIGVGVATTVLGFAWPPEVWQPAKLAPE